MGRPLPGYRVQITDVDGTSDARGRGDAACSAPIGLPA